MLFGFKTQVASFNLLKKIAVDARLVIHTYKSLHPWSKHHQYSWKWFWRPPHYIKWWILNNEKECSRRVYHITYTYTKKKMSLTINTTLTGLSSKTPLIWCIVIIYFSIKLIWILQRLFSSSLLILFLQYNNKQRFQHCNDQY